MLDQLILRARQLQAFFDTHPGNFMQKIAAAGRLRLAEGRGIKTAHRILRQNSDAMAAAVADLQAPNADAPPIMPGNTQIVVAAHLANEYRIQALLRNLPLLRPYGDAIRIYDMPQNLADDLKSRLVSATDGVSVAPKSMPLLLDQSCYHLAFSSLQPQYDYCLAITDTFHIVNSLQPFFDMANRHRQKFNAFSLTYAPHVQHDGKKHDFCGGMEFRLYNRRAAECYKRLYECVLDDSLAAIAAQGGRGDIYRFCFSLIIFCHEFGFSPYLRGRALFGPEYDKRLAEGLHIYHRPDLFREYLMEKGFPLIKFRSTQRRDFAFLHDFLPPFARGASGIAASRMHDFSPHQRKLL